MTDAPEDAWDRGMRAAFSAEATGASGPPSTSRYTIEEEIARGGVGIIHRGRDAQLGREVAIKTLQARHEGRPGLAARFIREARVASQLQHPGVVPVYDLGTDVLGRPFIAMKRVLGRTLEALLSERSDPADRRPHFLRIFEQVCQTMAYAHAKGVIHRDLKPGNVMVGAFGEVQVLDWGFAKALDGPPDEPHEPASAAASPSAGDGVASTVPGSALGTPCYMSPEQAAGRVDALDRRTDVFCLGAMLCQVLTGRPPVPGSSVREATRNAAEANYGDLDARLDASAADPALIALARECLRARMEDRPRDAGAVAERVSACLVAAEERARRAEVAAAEARARSHEERKAKRLTIALAAAVVALALGVLAYGWQRAEGRSRAEREVEAVLAEAAEHARREAWPEAEATARRAEALVRSRPVGPRVQGEVRERVDAYAEQRREHDLLQQIVRLRSAEGLSPPEIDRRYAEAFGALGIELGAGGPGASVRSWSAARLASVILALDHWASRVPPMERDLQARWRAVVETAAAIDGDPWRTELRRAVLAGDRARVEALAARLGAEPRPPQSYLLLGQALARLGAPPATELAALREGYRAHPGDFWINLTLAHRALDGRPDYDTAERHARVAMGLNPNHAESRALLGVVLWVRGRPQDRDEAVAHLRLAGDTTPADGLLGTAARAALLRSEGKHDEARALLREARRPRPPHLRAIMAALEN